MEYKDFSIYWHIVHRSSMPLPVALVRVGEHANYTQGIWTQDPVTANPCSPWHIVCGVIIIIDKRIHVIIYSQFVCFPFFFFSMSAVTFPKLRALISDTGWEGHLVDIIQNCTSAFTLLSVYSSLTCRPDRSNFFRLSPWYILHWAEEAWVDIPQISK